MNDTLLTSDLPIFIHSDLDDLPLSLEAFRVYAHLARRAGRNNQAWPSYNSIGEACFRKSYPKASRETLRRKAIAAVKELTTTGLIIRLASCNEKGQHATNHYCLTSRRVWGGSVNALGVVSTHYGSVNAPKDSPIEVSPVEVSPVKEDRFDPTGPTPTPILVLPEKEQQPEKSAEAEDHSSFQDSALGSEDLPGAAPALPSAWRAWDFDATLNARATQALAGQWSEEQLLYILDEAIRRATDRTRYLMGCLSKKPPVPKRSLSPAPSHRGYSQHAPVPTRGNARQTRVKPASTKAVVAAPALPTKPLDREADLFARIDQKWIVNAPKRGQVRDALRRGVAYGDLIGLIDNSPSFADVLGGINSLTVAA